MEPLSSGTPRGTRLALVALGLFALLVIVGFASRAGFAGASNASPSQTYLDYAFSVFFLLFVLAIPVAIYFYYLQRRESFAGGRAKRRPFVQAMAIVLVFTSLALILRHLKDFHGHVFFRARAAAKAAKNLKGHHGAAQPLEPHFQWPVLAAFLLLLAVALGAFLVARSRRKRRARDVYDSPEVKLELALAISDAIDDLEAEPDARKAVIAAYARMEGVLGRHGLPRRPSETPFEYLGRVLIDLRARADSVRRLTSLFERAKFSRHEINLRMKNEAIAALAAIRDDLRAAAAAT